MIGFGTLLCVLIAFANNALCWAVFSTGGIMAAYERINRWGDGAVAGLFALAGFGMLGSALAK